MIDATPSAARRTDSRRRRFRALRYLSHASVRKSGRWCMSAGVRAAPSVTVTNTAEHVSGIVRCASANACPVCAPVIRERRAGEIDALCSAVLEAGCRAYFVTATASHRLGDELADVLELVRESWTAAFSGRSAQASGYLGQVRVIEVTYGANGWHPHVHALLVFSPDAPSPRDALARFGTRYRQAVRARGGSVSDTAVGFHVRAVSSARATAGYLTKVSGGWGVGLELARGDVKRSAGKGATPWELLDRAAAGDARAARLFEVYERATAGRRLIVVSRKLSAAFGVELVSDEEAASADADEFGVVFVFQPRAWERWRLWGMLPRVLEALRAAVDEAVQIPPWIQDHVFYIGSSAYGRVA